MAAIGSSRLSFRAGGPWSGITLLSRTAPGRFALLEDAYVNSDGSEVRMMPGFRCVIDPETATRPTSGNDVLNDGYRVTHVDARRTPFIDFAGNAYYQVENPAPDENQLIWVNPGIMHGIEQVEGRWIFFGESDHRREPILDNARVTFVTVTSVSDDGSDITLTVNLQPSTVAGAANSVTVGDRLTLDGITGTLANTLNLKSHVVLSFPTATTIKIDSSSGAAVGATGQAANVARVRSNARNPLGVSDDTPEDLTIWTCLSKGDENAAPVTLVRPAHVANRMPDFGDALNNQKEGNANVATSNQGVSRRRRIGMPFRIVPHVSTNRLIMVAPGCGCVFQAPVIIPPSFTTFDTANGIGEFGNSIYDRPRALGVPKAVCWEDPDKAVATSFHVWAPSAPGPGVPDQLFGGSASASRQGTYQFKFAYFDEGTGEQGLCSEPITVTSDGSTVRQGFQFFVYFPGYLLHESLATSINVYRTTRGGKTFFFDRTIPMFAARDSFTPTTTKSSRYGLVPNTGSTDFMFHALYQAFFTPDDELRKQLNPVPDVLEQMPMGCKAARTIRGFTFFGGALGDSGSQREMVRGSVTFQHDPASALASLYPNHDEVTMAFTADDAAPVPSSFEGIESWLFTGARNIPSSYSGQTLVGRDLCPTPRKSLDLIKVINTQIGFQPALADNFLGRLPDIRFLVRDTPIAQTEAMTGSTRRKITAFLKLPRAKLQVSEPDNPNITPATNTITLANELDGDIEGIGDAGGQAVICTQSKTYFLGFSTSPIGGLPDVADERFGCIAPNSMVSFEGGCAWISDRGPVAMIGGRVEWIGEPIAPLFIGETARYERDGGGMMRHSWACHDAERSLLYFGMFSDRNAGTALEVKIPVGPNKSLLSREGLRGSATQDLSWSKFPCDEILVYSYRTGAWSIWKPPQPIQWMTRGVDAYGINRVFVLFQDRRLCVLDDNWVHGDKEAWRITASVAETTSTIVTALAHVMSWTGLSVAVLRTKTDGTKSIISRATIVGESISSGVTTATLDQPITTKVGDEVIIGMRSMRLRTTTMVSKQSESTRSGPATVCYALDSRDAVNGPGPYDAFVSARSISSRTVDGVLRNTDQSLNGDDDSNFTWLGSHQDGDATRDKRLAQGQTIGQGTSIEMTFLGNAQVRLQDIYAELG